MNVRKTPGPNLDANDGTTDEVGFVEVVDHPVVATRLTILRDVSTNPAQFRAALKELATLLVYEATRDLPLDKVEIDTPLQTMTAARVAAPPLLVPILRAGIGMADAAHALLPEAQMGFVGLKRDETTHEPASYLESVPDCLDNSAVLILDPMLATGGSLVHCASLLAARGARDVTVVCVLAAPEGIQRVRSSGLVRRVVTAHVDDRLDENAFIVPGLGDAGDRQFGAV